MSIRIYSASIQGIDAQPIEVEVDSAPGLHVFNIVGLPDKAVEESKDRIASAIRNSGLTAPSSKNKKIIVNLAPADVKKRGSSLRSPHRCRISSGDGAAQIRPQAEDVRRRAIVGRLAQAY